MNVFYREGAIWLKCFQVTVLEPASEFAIEHDPVKMCAGKTVIDVSVSV